MTDTSALIAIRMAESDIFCVKSGAITILLSKICYDHYLLSYKHFKTAVVNALFGKPLRANGNCDVTEIHLE